MITSSQNPKIQWVRQLQNRAKERREAGVFVAEGVRLVEEALQAGWQAHLVLHTADLDERGRAVVEGFRDRGAPVEAASPQALRVASDTEAPQGLLAVLEMRSLPTPQNPDLVLIPDGVRDPGNLGSRGFAGVPACRNRGRIFPEGSALGDGGAFPLAADGCFLG
jgi:TrmH family RNA methyltransferase